jgi:zinc protease
MIMVFTGDLDAKQIEKSLSGFKGWKGGVSVNSTAKATLLSASKEEKVVMDDKTSVTLTLGAPTGLSYSDSERLALYVGNYILGGNFAARLMSIVRDKEGLTYGIYSNLSGDDFADGSWNISGTFSPALLDKGYESTMRELKRFYEESISEEELNNKKSTITGQFKISLSTTGGMANNIHTLISRGRKISYLDEYAEKVNALTVNEVNAAIKKFMNPDKIMVIKAGTFEEK